MKRKLASLALVAAAVLAMSAPVHAQTSVPMEAVENGRLWFVELVGAPSIEGRATATVQAEQAAFRAAAAKAGLQYTERRSYSSLFNGMAIAINPNDRVKFMRVAGVKALHPVQVVNAPTPEVSAGSVADLATAITMTGANIAQNVRGLTGRGVKVGVIDTGIDIDHPAFGGGGVPGGTTFPTARVAYGYDFVGDAYDAGGTTAAQLTPVPDSNPDDCAGHGTHVAGIVGANGGGIKGVAPGVTFGAYRVFGCAGSTSDDIILAALERAHADGMQVINQSLGSSRQWPQAPTAQASSRLVAKGIVMVASIGNSGPGGSSPDALFAAGAPGVGKDVIGVASFDNLSSTQLAFTVTPAGELIAYNRASGSPPSPLSGSLPLARTGTATSTTDACAALPAGSLTGKAALVRRGGCTFNAKTVNAQNAGAAAIIIYNNAAGELNATVAGTTSPTIPAISVTAANGVLLDGKIAAGAATLTWTTQTVTTPIATGGLISGFSSFGLAADLTFKPDIGAPGGSIFSSYPLELGGAATLSGTSMSSPHVAGAAALILEAAPTSPANLMGAVMQNRGQPKLWSSNPALGLLDYSFRQGGGMLDIINVLDANAFVTPSDLSLGESEGGPYPTTITVDNRSGVLTRWTITHEPTVAAGPNTQSGASYALTGTFDAPATVVFDRTEIITPSRGIATFVVSITPNAALPDRSIYGGYIKITSEFGQVMRVPYAGFKGDYQSTVVLTPTANGFPWLAQIGGGSYNNRPSGATFTMVGDDAPNFLLHLDHQSRRLYLEVRDATTGRVMGKISDEDYLIRNATPGGAFVYSWDGVTFTGSPSNPRNVRAVPNGQYVVTVWVLKALGTDFVPAHWESWTSPVITIARP